MSRSTFSRAVTCANRLLRPRAARNGLSGITGSCEEARGRAVEVLAATARMAERGFSRFRSHESVGPSLAQPNCGAVRDLLEIFLGDHFAAGADVRIGIAALDGPIACGSA